MSIHSFAYSPIFKNIAGDTHILKRAEFRHHVDEIIKHDDFHTKSSREIVNEFNLLY